MPGTILFEPSEWWDFNGKGLLHLVLPSNKASREGLEWEFYLTMGTIPFAHVGFENGQIHKIRCDVHILS